MKKYHNFFESIKELDKNGGDINKLMCGNSTAGNLLELYYLDRFNDRKDILKSELKDRKDGIFEMLEWLYGNGVDLNSSAKKSIALFTHELKRSGAPTVLLNMSRVLVDIGYTVFLVADEDGELLEEFVESGVNVVFYPKLTSDPTWLLTVAGTFEHIVVNTLVLTNLVSFLAPYAKKIYWWIHEWLNGRIWCLFMA